MQLVKLIFADQRFFQIKFDPKNYAKALKLTPSNHECKQLFKFVE